MERAFFLEKIKANYRIHPICGILGPRQVGKTTLAKLYAKNIPNAHILDLENPHDLARLQNPLTALSEIDSELIIIDEIQRRPELFPVLRVLVDENKSRKFLILGSASRELLQQSSESLAGRIGYLELTPFSLTEIDDYKRLWVRGGFPLSYIAENDTDSYDWRQDYISTLIERDIPALGFTIPPLHIRRLWMMLAHNHGNVLNTSQLGNSLGLTHHTVRKYTDILAGTFMVRLLQPWFENISKRQVKTPKVYLRDSGLLHNLLDIENYQALQIHPKLGALWEGFALEELIKYHQARPEESFFWGTQSGAELDLLIVKKGKRIGFEIKYSDFPKTTKSMHVALEDLKLDHLYVIHPHDTIFTLDKKITALGLLALGKEKALE